jgi:hypothetical protein
MGTSIWSSPHSDARSSASINADGFVGRSWSPFGKAHMKKLAFKNNFI